MSHWLKNTNNLLRRRISNNLDFPVYVRADAYNRYAALSQGGPRDALYISKSKKSIGGIARFSPG